MGVAEDGQVLWSHEHLNGARHPRLTPDEPDAFEGEQHLVHGGRADLEVALQVGLGRRAAMDARIGIDEGQVLALLVREAGARRGLMHAADLIQGDLDQGGRHEHTLPGRAERG